MSARPVSTRPFHPRADLPAFVGRYRVLGVLGRGGMGIVYLAHDDRLDRDVAVKTLKPEFALDGETGIRFAAEAMALGRIRHPNVVRIFDLVDGAPQPAYAMEALQGRSLSRALRDDAALPPSMIRDILLQSAAALGAVHRAGMVHRDIKPSNLFLAEEDERQVVKLIDFGIALQRGNPRVTRPGEVIGTVRYMAPEQLVAGVLDARTDVFAWGVVASELLPAAARSPAIAALLDQCVRPAPEQRCGDMLEVAARLRTALEDGEDSTMPFGIRAARRLGGTERLAVKNAPAALGATERIEALPPRSDAPTLRTSTRRRGRVATLGACFVLGGLVGAAISTASIEARRPTMIANAGVLATEPATVACVPEVAVVNLPLGCGEAPVVVEPPPRVEPPLHVEPPTYVATPPSSPATEVLPASPDANPTTARRRPARARADEAKSVTAPSPTGIPTALVPALAPTAIPGPPPPTPVRTRDNPLRDLKEPFGR